MQLELENHVAMITGGASGIGLAAARGFLAEGARVALWDRSPDTASVADSLSTTKAIGLTVDICQPHQVASALTMVQQQFGRVDHLVHAAAIGSGKFGFPFTNLSPADWPRVLEVNILGMVHVAHAVAPVLQQQQSGSMTFIASVAGQIGSQTDPPYSASKAANINFAQCLAKDLAPHGVRVNTVCPGMVQTPLNRAVWQAWHDQQPPADRLNYEEWAGRKVKSVIPLGKWQTLESIADMILFLSSARAAHVTGQTMNVDGGFVMHW